MVRIGKKLMFILAAVIIVVIAVVSVYSCNMNPDYHIAIVFSNNKDYHNYSAMLKQMKDEFRKAGKNVELTDLYLFCEHFNENEEKEEAKRLLNEAMKNHQVDMIFTVGDQATYSTLCSGHELIDSVPVVFGSVIYPNEKLLSRHPNTTGIKDEIDIVENILICPILTGHRHTYTMIDRSFLDRKTFMNVREQIAKKESIIDNLDWDYRLVELSQMPENVYSITSFSLRNLSRNTHESIQQDSLGASNMLYVMRRYSHFTYIQLKYDSEAMAMIKLSGIKPMVTAIEADFGLPGGSFVGGYFASPETIATDMVDCAVQIMDGKKPQEIPIRASKKEHFIDWQAAKKYGFTKDMLPQGFIVKNMPWRDKFPHLYLTANYTGGIVLFVIIVLLIIRLLRIQRQKRILQKVAEQDKSMFNLAIQDNQTFVWKRHGDTITLGDSFWEFFGQTPHETTSCEFNKRVHPDDVPLLTEGMRRIEQGEEYTSEVRLDINGNGEYHWYRLRGKGILAEDGSFERAYGMLVNIDVFRQREAELEEARRLAEEAQLKESFLANMSHEIRTPLNAIVGFSNLLLQPDADFSPEEKQLFAETINTNNELLLKLINDILDISRIESGEMDFDIKSCKVSEIVEKAYNTFLVQMPEHLEFKMQADELDAMVQVDDSRLRQVLANFLTNAGKFTPKGSVTIGWHIDLEHQKAEMYVEDTGIGMTDEDRKMVFNRFYKKDEFKQGTGLGLSICKAIVIRLGGSIKVSSELGKGSRFSIFLKINRGGEFRYQGRLRS